MNNAEVLIKFKGDSKDIDKTIKDVGKSSLSVGNIVKGNLISGAITSGLKAVVGGIKSVTSAVGGLAASGGFDRAVNIENAEHKLTGLGHSAEEVQGIMDSALKSVKGTAYGMDEAATVAASAVAAGVKPGQDLERTLKLVGDAAAISGRDMTSMGAIFNKVAAGGKMTGEELNQLTDSGIPMLQLLGKTMGKTNEEVRDMISKGEIGFDEFRNAIEEGMGGAALKMGETFEGAMANTKAAMSRLGKTFMDPFIKGMTPALNTLIQIIDLIAEGSTDGLEELTKTLSTQLQTMINNVIKVVVPLIQNSIPVITQLIQSLVEALPGIIDTLLPQLLNVITMIINAIITILPPLVESVLPGLLNAIVQIVMEIAKILPKLIPIIIKALVSGIKSLASALPQIIQALVDGTIALFNALAEELPTLIPILIDALINGIMVLLENIDAIITAGIQILMALIQGIIAAIPTLVAKLPMIITAIINAIIGALPQLILMAPQIIMALITGIIQSIPILVDALPQIIESMITGLEAGIKSFIEEGKKIIKSMLNGIQQQVPVALAKIKEIPKKILQGIKNGLAGISDVGKNLIRGLWSGISDKVSWVVNKIKNLGKSVISAAKSIFGIKSPSREFAYIGEMNMVGFEKGMDGMKGKVQDTIDSVFDLQPSISGQLANTYSPQMNIQVVNNLETDPLGQLVNKVKTFSGGAKNDYNWGAGL